MRGDLETRGIRLIALSKDDVAAAAAHRERDGLGFTLLSDPSLEVIRRYGVEHHKALEVSKLSFTLFGLPVALVPSFKAMAIPTTLLVDEHGTIRWIDQTEDYRVRSGKARVLTAIDAAFGDR